MTPEERHKVNYDLAVIVVILLRWLVRSAIMSEMVLNTCMYFNTIMLHNQEQYQGELYPQPATHLSLGACISDEAFCTLVPPQVPLGPAEGSLAV